MKVCVSQSKQAFLVIHKTEVPKQLKTSFFFLPEQRNTEFILP